MHIGCTSNSPFGPCRHDTLFYGDHGLLQYPLSMLSILDSHHLSPPRHISFHLTYITYIKKFVRCWHKFQSYLFFKSVTHIDFKFHIFIFRSVPHRNQIHKPEISFSWQFGSFIINGHWSSSWTYNTCHAKTFLPVISTSINQTNC